MSASVDSGEALALKVKVDAQGEKVRELKTSGGDKVRTGMVVVNKKSLNWIRRMYCKVQGPFLGKPFSIIYYLDIE